MKVTVARTSESLKALQTDWNTFAGEMPFRTWEWSAIWWRHYRDLGRLFVLSVLDEQDRVIGIAPWYIHSSPRGRLVRFLGSGDVCTDYQTLLCRPGEERQVAGAIAQWLNSDRADEWDVLDFEGIEAADAPMQALMTELAQAGNSVEQQAAQSCWRVQLPETWDEYLATLSKKRRARARKRLKEVVDTGRAQLFTVENEQQFDRGFDILVLLHRLRWADRDEASEAFSSGRFTEFHRDVAKDLLERGQLGLHWLELDGTPVFAEYQIVGGGVVYTYQNGMHPEYLHEEPGTLCNLMLIRRAQAAGFREYDFLRGDEHYKAILRAEPRPCVDVRVVANSVVSKLRHGAWKAGRWLNRWLDGKKPAPEAAGTVRGNGAPDVDERQAAPVEEPAGAVAEHAAELASNAAQPSGPPVQPLTSEAQPATPQPRPDSSASVAALPVQQPTIVAAQLEEPEPAAPPNVTAGQEPVEHPKPEPQTEAVAQPAGTSETAEPLAPIAVTPPPVAAPRPIGPVSELPPPPRQQPELPQPSVQQQQPEPQSPEAVQPKAVQPEAEPAELPDSQVAQPTAPTALETDVPTSAPSAPTTPSAAQHVQQPAVPSEPEVAEERPAANADAKATDPQPAAPQPVASLPEQPLAPAPAALQQPVAAQPQEEPELPPPPVAPRPELPSASNWPAGWPALPSPPAASKPELELPTPAQPAEVAEDDPTAGEAAKRTNQPSAAPLPLPEGDIPTPEVPSV